MKSPLAFRSIGEVARLVGVATHVLRYWETQFSALAPVRRPDGRRYYRPDDLLLAAGLCEVMREDGLTIRGARRLIDMDKGVAVRERGRLRLHDMLARQPDDAHAQRRRTNGGAAGALPRRRGTANGATPAAMAAPAPKPTDAMDAMDGRDGRAPIASANSTPVAWLTRLSATAAALRHRPTPLPQAARALAQALHAAWARRT